MFITCLKECTAWHGSSSQGISILPGSGKECIVLTVGGGGGSNNKKDKGHFAILPAA